LLGEDLGDGFDQPHAAIVAIVLDGAGQVLEAGEGVVVDIAREELDLGALVEIDVDAEVGEGKGDGLAKVPVRGIAEEAGAGIGAGVEEHGNSEGMREET
jgi:hypothetical protein